MLFGPGVMPVERPKIKIARYSSKTIALTDNNQQVITNKTRSLTGCRLREQASPQSVTKAVVMHLDERLLFTVTAIYHHSKAHLLLSEAQSYKESGVNQAVLLKSLSKPNHKHRLSRAYTQPAYYLLNLLMHAIEP